MRSRSRSRAVDGEDALQARVDEARAARDTAGGVVEVQARGVPPGLGSYASRETRLDGRLAAALMSIQAVKGVEIGDGFALATPAGQRRTTKSRTATSARRTAPAGSRRACRTARRSSCARR